MDTLQLLDKVHGFYTDSFSQLITLTIAILGFSGLLLPIIIQFIQTRIFKVEQKALQSQISQEVQLAKAALKSELEAMFNAERNRYQEQFKEQVKSVKQSIKEQAAVAKGGNFFLQGTQNYAGQSYAQATWDYAHAARLFFEGKDDQNGQRALDILLKGCLPALDGSSFEQVADLETVLNMLLAQLEIRDENKRFYDSILAIRSKTAQAKKRPTPQKASKDVEAK
ncbi:MAG: hypothetical protein KIT50_12230 [Bacteroidetes bacterium]|nr:hypothetical protein [Bacteroidota bacterium]